MCASKDTELRQLHHKLYNDLVGKDKNVVFNDYIETLEFEGNHPVNVDANRVKNFIQHNKKRIRSRSKNSHTEGPSTK